MIGSYLGWCLATGVAVAVGLVVVGTIRHNLRIWRLRRDYKSLPNEVKEQVLRLIQEAAVKRRSVTFLRLDEEHKCEGNDVLLQSHVGGVPYAEAGEKWPSGSPAKF
jgi:hypothetical protein